MTAKLDWSLDFPISDTALLPNTLNVRYRGTSGAGQFELAGSSTLKDGTVFRSRDAINLKIKFVLRNSDDHTRITISDTYPIRDTGGKVRIAVKDDAATRPNVGNLFAALFLLPETSQKDKASPLAQGPLAEKTFWIDDIDTVIVGRKGSLLLLEPVGFILASSNKDDSAQLSAACYFDFKTRISKLSHVLQALRHSTSDSASAAAGYYLDVLNGKVCFEFAVGNFMRDLIFDYLVDNDPAYTRGEDPLDFLEKIAGQQNVTEVKEIDQPRNYIFFGAPGTGKSHQLNKLALGDDANPGLFAEENVRRVTFYPDYTYSQFVGCFRPFTKEGEIGYRYIPGPFLETYIEASLHPYKNYLLIIEELNRANPAAVFGDVFQLLDRDAYGASKYYVTVPMEMADCIQESLKELKDDEQADIENFFDPYMDFDEFSESMVKHLALPPNMYIWSTMNSADQGVFPMDTAFKRRWDFKYMGINDGADAILEELGDQKLSDVTVNVAGSTIAWNDLRCAINDLMTSCNINEDKLLGPFFVSPDALTNERFVDVFKDKVLLYLYEDAGKMKRSKLFRNETATYSALCEQFEEEGVAVFKGIEVDNVIVESDVGELAEESED